MAKGTLDAYLAAVWRGEGISAPVQVLLAYLCQYAVTIPNLRVTRERRLIAKDFAVNETVIKQRTRKAVDAGYLYRISHARDGRPATYQLTFPAVSPSYPSGHLRGMSKETPSPVRGDTPESSASPRGGVSPSYPLSNGQPETRTDRDAGQTPCPECEFAGCAYCEGWAIA